MKLLSDKQIKKIQAKAAANLAPKTKGKGYCGRGKNAQILPGDVVNPFEQIANEKAEARRKAEQAAQQGHTKALDRLDILEGTRNNFAQWQRK